MGSSDAGSRLIEAMRCPEFYPDHPAQVDFKQTHMSWVFLAGDEFYKVKKPVHYALPILGLT